MNVDLTNVIVSPLINRALELNELQARGLLSICSGETKGYFSSFLEQIETMMHGARRDRLNEMAALCESPIEKQLFEQLIMASGQHHLPVFFDPYRIRDEAISLSGIRRSGLAVYPQCEVDRWRVDFVIGAADHVGGAVLLAVECDGHDFHEKTKDQAARDKRRDRDLLALGLNVCRFTGSEIHRDARACADEVMNLVDSLIEQRIATARVSEVQLP